MKLKRRTLNSSIKDQIKVSKKKGEGINIFELGTLVQLETHSWQAVKRLPKDLAKEFGEDVDAGWINANKTLINRKTLQSINGYIFDARQAIVSKALPFPIKSVFFVPKEKIEELNEELSTIKKKFVKEVRTFVSQYDEHVEKAADNLGHLFNEADYPRNIEDRFSIFWRFFDLTIPSNVTDEIYEEETKRFNSLMEETRKMGIMALREGFAEIVSHLTDTISGKIDGDKRRLRQDALDKVSLFFSELQNKNVFNDEDLQNIVIRAKDVVEGVTVKDINTDMDLAKELNGELETIKKELLSSTEKVRRRLSFKNK